MDNKYIFEISNDAKKEYLNKLTGKIHKILHLIEEEETSGFSPCDFIAAQLYEINAANNMFDGKLITIMVKIRVIYDNYKSMGIAKCRSYINESQKIINSLLRELG